MKVLVLLHGDLVPPEKFESKTEYLQADCKTEFDIVTNLKKIGHKVHIVAVRDDLKKIRTAIEEFKPAIVFNLLEEFAGEAVFDHNVVSYLEMLGVKYTGCNPRGLMLARDKALSKKVLKYHRIPTPNFYVFRKNKRVKAPSKVKYPLFVKTLNEEASLGLSDESIVHNEENLLKRVSYLQEKFNTDVIAESYIKGKEYYVGVVGNESLKVLPVWELFFSKAPDKTHKIATSKVKWDFAYREKLGIKTGAAKDIPTDMENKIQNLAKRAYRALELSGYARMDFRTNEATGEVFLIEANPNPDIGDKEDLASSAMKANLPYEKLLTKILNLGRKWSSI